MTSPRRLPRSEAEPLVVLKVATPTGPNFVRVGSPGHMVDVATLSDETIRELGKAWTNQLLANARRRRQSNRRAPAEDEGGPRHA